MDKNIFKETNTIDKDKEKNKDSLSHNDLFNKTLKERIEMKQKFDNIRNYKEMEINNNNNMHNGNKKRKIEHEIESIDEKKILKKDGKNNNKIKDKDKESSDWDMASSTIYND